MSSGTASSALMFSTTCSGVLAPVMTVDTCSFRRHHAIESCVKVIPSSSAISFIERTLALRASSVSMVLSHS